MCLKLCPEYNEQQEIALSSSISQSVMETDRYRDRCHRVCWAGRSTRGQEAPVQPREVKEGFFGKLKPELRQGDSRS